MTGFLQMWVELYASSQLKQSPLALRSRCSKGDKTREGLTEWVVFELWIVVGKVV